MRLFVAIELPAEVRAEVARWCAVARDALPERSIRWVPAENLHVTLAFLGDTGDDRIPAITSALDTCAASCPPLGLYLEGAGRFTAAAWVGLGGDVRPLADVAGCVGRALGVEDRRPFRAHLTVGRFRDPRRSRRLVLPGPTFAATPFEVDELVLFASELRRDGPPAYVAVHRARLQAR